MGEARLVQIALRFSTSTPYHVLPELVLLVSGHLQPLLILSDGCMDGYQYVSHNQTCVATVD